jgi:hypothetical protein
MMYEQDVMVLDDHRVTFEVPREFPVGATVRLKVVRQEPTAVVADSARAGKKPIEDIVREMWESLPTIEECKQKAEAKYAARKASGGDTLMKFHGSKIFGDLDGLTYQRSMRDEWPD